MRCGVDNANHDLRNLNYNQEIIRDNYNSPFFEIQNQSRIQDIILRFPRIHSAWRGNQNRRHGTVINVNSIHSLQENVHYDLFTVFLVSGKRCIKGPLLCLYCSTAMVALIVLAYYKVAKETCFLLFPLKKKGKEGKRREKMGKDGKRWEKKGKEGKRREKMGKDGKRWEKKGKKEKEGKEGKKGKSVSIYCDQICCDLHVMFTWCSRDVHVMFTLVLIHTFLEH